MSTQIYEPTRRACGTRKRGGYYIEVATSPFGRPVADFILDPTIPWNQGPFQGVRLYEVNGQQFVLDWVGETYYPYPADFLAETTQMGISRRIPKTFPFHDLKPNAKLVLIHSKVIPNPPPTSKPHKCMGNIHLLPHDDSHCGGWLYHAPSNNDDPTVRKLPNLTFSTNVHQPTPAGWSPGMFAAFPITRIAYVVANDERDEEAQQVKQVLSQNGVAFTETDK